MATSTSSSDREGAVTTPQKRISKACDACQARKVRCLPIDTSVSSDISPTPICEGCAKRRSTCTFEAERKKRGPAPRSSTNLTTRRPPVPILSKKEAPTVLGKRLRTTGNEEQGRDTHAGGHYGALDPASGTRTLHSPLASHSHGSDHVRGWTPQIPPHSNPLTAVIPRALLEHAISVYFQYVYGLVPIVHRPSFLADFHSNREELPGEEEWTALVLSVAGLTMAQIPWAFGPMSKDAVRDMVQSCYNRVKEFLFVDFGKPTVWRCVLLYLSVIMATRLGHWGNREMFLGANWSLIYKLKLHDESSYVGEDHIELEIRRRVYWLALGFDKASTASRGAPVMITREHCATVELPTAIDDEFLTREGYSPPSHGGTSFLTGFRYVSRLYDLFGQILDMRRLDQLRRPSGLALEMRIAEVEEVFQQIITLMSGCPEELRLRDDPDTLAGVLDWADDAFASIRALFEDGTQRVVADGFLVQQANIYSAIQMARQLTIRYRADLFTLRSAEGPPREGLSAEEAMMEEETDRTASDLIKMLHTIPTEVLAVNGDALVNKIRLVAASQLDALDRLGAIDAQHDAVQAQKLQSAQNHLLEFLGILGDIETLYSLTGQICMEL